MVKLKKYLTEELEEELEKRTLISQIPLPLIPPNFNKLTKYIMNGMQNLAVSGYPGKDFENYIFEKALESIYGENIWLWWNSLYGEK